MGDRRSDTPYSGDETSTKEASVGMKADARSIQQLTSSSESAKLRRNQKGLQSLEKAVAAAADKDKEEIVERNQESSGQGGQN